MKNWCLKTIAFISILILSMASARAQYVPEANPKKDTTIYVPSASKPTTSENSSSKGFQKDKLVPGGNLALNFGTSYYIDISPFLGYRFTPDLLLGLGLTYVYSGGTYQGGKYSNSYYGGRIFGRYRVYDNFYAIGELEFLNVPDFYTNTKSHELRRWLVSPMIGGGYVIPIGDRGGAQISMLYNLNYQPLYSPYPNALTIRAGVFF